MWQIGGRQGSPSLNALVVVVIMAALMLYLWSLTKLSLATIYVSIQIETNYHARTKLSMSFEWKPSILKISCKSYKLLYKPKKFIYCIPKLSSQFSGCLTSIGAIGSSIWIELICIRDPEDLGGEIPSTALLFLFMFKRKQIKQLHQEEICSKHNFVNHEMKQMT